MFALLREGKVGITATVRQAKLRPECAELYPTLPARMWTSAAWLAQLVTPSRRARAQRPGKAEKERTLPEADFEFRGGSAHWLGGSTAHTRTGESVFS
jgi:hypothetical protein